MVDTVLVDLSLPRVKILRDVVGDFQRFQPLHRRQNASDLLRGHWPFLRGCCSDCQKDFFTVGKPARGRHVDPGITNGGFHNRHSCLASFNIGAYFFGSSNNNRCPARTSASVRSDPNRFSFSPSLPASRKCFSACSKRPLSYASNPARNVVCRSVSSKV